ncbi:MAG: hypothetical protein OFPII_17970 [Osedax symbiont Rs1]|nr:MAG: hypothetical protein OFPII_17970 [Osedax symbiont Rs1]
MENDSKGAGVKFPPPLIYIIAVLLGSILQRYVPLTIYPNQTLWLAAGFAFLIAIILAVSALLGLRKAKTSIEPWRPTSNIVDSGVFAYSRNPIYLSFICFGFGMAFSLNSYWIMLLMIPATWLIKTLVIAREEQYLSIKFAEEYHQYCRKVRRWI